VQGVWKWSVWEWYFKLVILGKALEIGYFRKVFETGVFGKGV
jgi:hypothetical protein